MAEPSHFDWAYDRLARLGILPARDRDPEAYSRLRQSWIANGLPEASKFLLAEATKRAGDGHDDQVV